MKCPTCGQDARWIEQYGRYYCYNCKAYLAAGLPAPEPKTPLNLKPIIKTQETGKVITSSVKISDGISSFGSYSKSFSSLFKNPMIFVPALILFGVQFLLNYFVTGVIVPQLMSLALSIPSLLMTSLLSDPFTIFNLVWLSLSQILMPLIIFVVVNLITYSFVSTSYLVGAKKIFENGSVKLGDLLKTSFNKTVKVMAGLILWGLVISLGFLLLVIPGLILALLFFYTCPVYALEDKSIRDSLKYSLNVGKRNVGKTISFSFVTLLVLIVFAIISSIATIPFSSNFQIISNLTSSGIQNIDTAQIISLIPSLISTTIQSSLIQSTVNNAINMLIVQPVLLMALAILYLKGLKKP